jgi:hypothetical protein
MRIGVHAVMDVGRNTRLDTSHAKPDLSATLLINLTAQVAGGVIEASRNT